MDPILDRTGEIMNRDPFNIPSDPEESGQPQPAAVDYTIKESLGNWYTLRMAFSLTGAEHPKETLNAIIERLAEGLREQFSNLAIGLNSQLSLQRKIRYEYRAELKTPRDDGTLTVTIELTSLLKGIWKDNPPPRHIIDQINRLAAEAIAPTPQYDYIKPQYQEEQRYITQPDRAIEETLLPLYRPTPEYLLDPEPPLNPHLLRFAKETLDRQHDSPSRPYGQLIPPLDPQTSGVEKELDVSPEITDPSSTEQ
jgi:hypothetical protein